MVFHSFIVILFGASITIYLIRIKNIQREPVELTINKWLTASRTIFGFS